MLTCSIVEIMIIYVNFSYLTSFLFIFLISNNVTDDTFTNTSSEKNVVKDHNRKLKLQSNYLRLVINIAFIGTFIVYKVLY